MYVYSRHADIALPHRYSYKSRVFEPHTYTSVSAYLVGPCLSVTSSYQLPGRERRGDSQDRKEEEEDKTETTEYLRVRIAADDGYSDEVSIGVPMHRAHARGLWRWREIRTICLRRTRPPIHLTFLVVFASLSRVFAYRA